MEDHNKLVLHETVEEIIIDFDIVCRFCLTETKNGIKINDTCLSGESQEVERCSIYNFMTKCKFIKMEASDMLPSQICKNCFQLIQLCFDFNQICQKSESLLQECYLNSINKSKEMINKTELKISVKDPNIKKEGSHTKDHNSQNLGKISNFSTLKKEINATKKTNFEQTLKPSVNIVDTCRKRLNALSGRIKKSQSEVCSNKNSKAFVKEVMYSCSQCLLKFNNSGDLNLHLVVTHGHARLLRFKCQRCTKVFRDQENLKRHYKMIHKIKEIPDETVSIQGISKKFVCFHCVPYKDLQSEEELMQHLNDSHQNEVLKIIPKMYACSYCSDLTFHNRTSVNGHLLSAHKIKEHEIKLKDVKCITQDPKVLVCTNPTPHYNTKLSSLLQVLNSVVDSLSVAQQGKGFKIVCKNCNPPPEFTSSNDFAQHIRNHHDESKLLQNWATKNIIWTCSECPATYTRKQTLCYHMREKHKQTLKGIKCPESNCQESFLTNRQLIQHGISVHQKYFAYFHRVFKKILQPDTEEDGNREKNFECDICQRKYIYKSSLRKHILTTHLGQLVKDSAVCPYCGKTVSSKLNLKSHIEFVHEALFVSCPICKKKINFRTIGKHYKTHKTNSEMTSSKNSFLCNLCGKILKSKRSFEDHQKLHKNIRDELCDICGSGFTTKKFLRLHKKTHEGTQRKMFSCDKCDKVFSGRHTLNRHLLTHSGEKNFICEMCSKCFYTLQELNRHVRYHKKVYRFNCQLCEMRFLDKSRFRHHMMRHRNVRPHKCQFCDKMFIVKGKMNVHMARKHNFEVQDTKGVWKDPKTYVPLDDLL